MTGLRNTAVGLTLLALTGLALPIGAYAGFEEGVKAYEAKDYKTALDEWLPLAKANDPAAMRNVGHLYRRGLGTEQDFKKALTWYKRAATMGFDRAQANVAGMYLNGEGVEQDFLQAASWFAKAAEQGHVLARYNLGLMFETGLGVSQNMDKAKALFELAAGDGHPQAKERLALLAAREDKPEDPDKEIIVAIEEPPKAPIKKVPATPPTAASAASSTEAAANSQVTPPAAVPVQPTSTAASSASVVTADEAAPEQTEKTAEKTTSQAKAPVQKKGFYDALRSLRAKKPTAAMSTAEAPAPQNTAQPTDSAEAPESAAEKATETTTETTTAEIVKPSPPVTAAAESPSPTTVRAEVDKPVVVAAVPPVTQTASAAAKSGPKNGLTLEEKLEMADLAFALKEYQQSLSIWAILAQEGNAEAQYKLGTMFHNGLAVPVDRVRAYFWWEKAKNNGSPEAATALAGLEKSLTHMEKRQIQRTN